MRVPSLVRWSPPRARRSPGWWGWGVPIRRLTVPSPCQEVPSPGQEVPWLVGTGGSKLMADGALPVSDGPLPVPGGPLPCQEVPWLVGMGVPQVDGLKFTFWERPRPQLGWVFRLGLPTGTRPE